MEQGSARQGVISKSLTTRPSAATKAIWSGTRVSFIQKAAVVSVGKRKTMPVPAGTSRRLESPRSLAGSSAATASDTRVAGRPAACSRYVCRRASPAAPGATLPLGRGAVLWSGREAMAIQAAASAATTRATARSRGPRSAGGRRRDDPARSGGLGGPGERFTPQAYLVVERKYPETIQDGENHPTRPARPAQGNGRAAECAPFPTTRPPFGLAGPSCGTPALARSVRRHAAAVSLDTPFRETVVHNLRAAGMRRSYSAVRLRSAAGSLVIGRQS